MIKQSGIVVSRPRRSVVSFLIGRLAANLRRRGFVRQAQQGCACSA